MAEIALDPGSVPRLDPAYEARYLELVAAHGPAVARVAASYELGAAERQDLTQDIWFAVWRALPRFRGECSERTFVFRIAHNRGVSHAIRRRLPAEALDDDVRPLPDPAPGPEHAAESAQDFERLLEALHTLPITWREVAVLRMEGLGTAEIAAVLGITDNNVSVRLNRARRRLRSLMEA